MFVVIEHDSIGYDDSCEIATFYCTSSELPDMVPMGHDSSMMAALEKWSDSAHNGDILRCLDDNYIIIKCGDKDAHHPREPLVSQLVSVQTIDIQIKPLAPPKPAKKMAARKKR